MTQPEKSQCERELNPRSAALEVDAFTTWPMRWCGKGEVLNLEIVIKVLALGLQQEEFISKCQMTPLKW